jgi:acetyl-CoA acetyltransferase
MVLMAGLAETIVLAYGTNQGTLIPNGFAGPGSTSPYGFDDVIGGWAALMFERHRARYGMTEQQLGAVAVAQRRWAQLNPGAVRREPLAIDDYLAAPYYIKPIREYDVCPFDDGGGAIVMTTAERAGAFAHPPVYVLGMAQTSAPRQDQNRDNLDRAWVRKVADAVFDSSGIDRSDVGFVSIQDPGSMWTIQMLEHFGFVDPGEAGAFIDEGRTSPGGELPVNTSGGHLSESYMWGWLHTAEVARQLRGECGERQVPKAEVGMHCSTMGDMKAAATIYGTHQ